MRARADAAPGLTTDACIRSDACFFFFILNSLSSWTVSSTGQLTPGADSTPVGLDGLEPPRGTSAPMMAVSGTAAAVACTVLDGTTTVYKLSGSGGGSSKARPVVVAPAANSAPVLAAVACDGGATFSVDVAGYLTARRDDGTTWRYCAHRGAARAVAASPSGHTVVTAGDDGRVAVWAGSPDALVQVGAYHLPGSCTGPSALVIVADALGGSGCRIAVGDNVGHLAWLSWRA